MREKITRFMQGRYGVDDLSKALMYVGLVVIVVSLFTSWSVLSLIGWVVLIVVYVRMFSKNHARCYAQNQKYLQYINKVKGFFRRKKSHMEQRKTHHIYACPSCKQKIRIPKGKGKIEISCPKCHTKFVKRS